VGLIISKMPISPLSPPGGGVRLNGIDPKLVLLGGVALKELVRRAQVVARQYPQSFAGKKAAALDGGGEYSSSWGSAEPPPWADLPDCRLKAKLRLVLPSPKPETDLYIPVPPPPIQVLELDGEVDNIGALAAVLATMRALRPFKVTTLSLRNCACFGVSSNGKSDSSADVAIGLLAAFLEERRFNDPPKASRDKRPVEACLEVLYVSGSVESPNHLATLDAAWRKSGHLHSLTPAPPLPLTFRRKPTCYRPSRPERLASMPSWAAQSVDVKPKGKGKGKKGKKKK